MRIFKNRGDIYFSKSNKKKSTEQKILIIALACVIAFTAVFLIALGISSDFSAKKFFAPDETQKITEDGSDNQIAMPQTSGKANFISIVYKKDSLFFVQLVQADMDNVSYKAASLKSETVVDGNTLSEIFKKSGSENVKNAVESLLGIEIDYYIEMSSENYASFFNSLGTVNYPIASDIKYKSTDDEESYSIKFKSGEQSISGAQAVNLIRYYLDTDNTSAANDFLLNSLLQQINQDNLENSDELFSEFISSSQSNITVKNYSLASDNLTVLANENTSIGVYSAAAEYDNNALTQDNIQKLKSYFVK